MTEGPEVNFRTDINLHGNSVRNIKIDSLASAPTTDVEAGRVYYNTTDSTYYYYNGTDWKALALRESLDSYQLLSEKDAASGYAGLDSSGKVAIGEIPAGATANTVPLLVASVTDGYLLRYDATAGGFVGYSSSNIYTYKGSCTYANLPTDATAGDVYNVTDAHGNYPAGTNWAWTGTEWDALGGSIDLSGYQTRANMVTTLASASDSTYPTTLAVSTALAEKQDTLTAGSGISISDGTVSVAASGVTASSYGSTTAIPVVTVGEDGRVTAASTVAVYPPTTAGTSGQYWTSDGSGAGVWTTPASEVSSTSTALVTSAAVASATSSLDTRLTSVETDPSGMGTVVCVSDPDVPLLVEDSTGETVFYGLCPQAIALPAGTYTLTIEDTATTVEVVKNTVVSALNMAHVKTIDLNDAVIALSIGDTVTIGTTIYPIYAGDRRLVWPSDNEEAVIVNDGLISAMGLGHAKVTCEASDGYGASASLYVVVETILDTVALGTGITGYVAEDGCLVIDVAKGSAGIIYNFSEGSEPFIDYADTVTTCVMETGLVTMGGRVLKGLTLLESVYLPETLTRIRNYAFYGCSSLESVDLSSVTSIEGGAFRDCSSLVSVGDLSSVTSIGGNAFNGCSALTSIDLPHTLTTVMAGAFYQCVSVTRIVFRGKEVEINAETSFRLGKSSNNVTADVYSPENWAEDALTALSIPYTTFVFHDLSELDEEYQETGE